MRRYTLSFRLLRYSNRAEVRADLQTGRLKPFAGVTNFGLKPSLGES